jgi:hypothetical protein
VAACSAVLGLDCLDLRGGGARHGEGRLVRSSACCGRKLRGRPLSD